MLQAHSEASYSAFLGVARPLRKLAVFIAVTCELVCGVGAINFGPIGEGGNFRQCDPTNITWSGGIPRIDSVSRRLIPL
ncbi:hypothetical protein C8Q80DRAFT_770586 [Daedaleopsis nitida]|nr:hypothetical protein C8Q80DRAFT_770586 [Daedaleopsis nitida]